MAKELGKAEVILDATFILLNSKPYHAIKLDEIAELAKVGKGTIYRYFKDKDDLFLQLIERGNSLAMELFCACINDASDLRGKLYCCAMKMHELFVSSGAIFRIISEELELHNRYRGKNQVLRCDSRPLDRAVTGIFRKYIDEGEITNAYSAEFLSSMLCGIFRSLSFESELSGKEEPDFGAAIDFILNGLTNK